MSGKYWIKLYHEILDDPKMMKLSDRLAWRTIQIFLIAGRYDQDGLLPSMVDMAWQLRTEVEQLETDLIELQQVGILSVVDSYWFVTKFAERQATMDKSEYMRRLRKGKQREQYYGKELPEGYQSVTKGNGEKNRLTDTDKENNTLPARTETPSNLSGWLEQMKESKNKQAVLLRMIKEIYPDAVEYPEYSYIAKMAKELGGAGRLAALLWECVPREPKGDILAYIKGYSKSNFGKESKGRSEAEMLAALEARRGDK